MLLVCKTPTAGFTMQTLFLLIERYRWRILHTKDLVHWLPCCHIVVGKPAFPIKWAGIFMLPPIHAFCRVCFKCVGQTFILPAQ